MSVFPWAVFATTAAIVLVEGAAVFFITDGSRTGAAVFQVLGMATAMTGSIIAMMRAFR